MRTLRRIAAAMLAITALAGRADAAIILTLVPQQGFAFGSLTQGVVFDARIEVSGMTGGDRIDSFTIREAFGEYFSVRSIVAGAGLPDPAGFSSGFSPDSFTVAYSGPTPIMQNGTLAVIELLALTAGSGQFAVTGSFGIPNDSTLLPSGLGASFTIIGPTTSPVPEPSSLAMCGIAGVAGLAIARRRRRKQTA